MKVTQERLPDSQIGLEIKIPAETLEKAYEKKVNTLARTANIPGFRKGKVPRKILLQRLGTKYVKAATLEELIQESVEKAIKQEELESLGNYRLCSDFEELLGKFSLGQPLTFSAVVDVPPSVELGDYKTLSVKAEETIYDPKQVEIWLEERREQQAALIPVEDRSAQMGDVAIIDYVAYFVPEDGQEVAGKAISGVQGTDFRVDLAEGRFIEGMVEGIVGMKPEETKELKVTFPEDYPREDLAGRPSIFSITLKELKEKEFLEFNDDLAGEISEFETIAELRESLEKRFIQEAEEATKKSIHDSIIAQLMTICTVDIPETLVQNEVTQVLTQTAMQMEQMGMEIGRLFTQENLPKLRENARPEAIERLKQSLILKELAKVEGIEIKQAIFDEKVNKIKEQLSDREVDLDRLNQMVTDELLIEATLDWLQGQATIELVPAGTLKKKEAEQSSADSGQPLTATAER
ncbi:trigger factor [cyanobacterium endosymbiont of Rhopalodia gibberula]|uniref:trigger factor n=1 Tax=cyanobacterium endosymbiont of Rhopalodia gibberula TaxID=1763363 RepID=UPI000DC7203B|nr:trigger factor [cyanobacterium endosymbiont of Rhopalodia gibberula]BBA79213.1 trigger factor [cyanobacterium endosymbiont of Rhopalodia gibberula]